MRLTRRHIAWCAALLAATGCEKFSKHHDLVEDVVAETTTPIRARLVVYEYDVKPECTETGVLRFRCFFQSEQRGCAFVELGDSAPWPLLEGIQSAGELRCRRWGFEPTRRQVSGSPLPSRGVELVADPTGTRLAWRAAPTDGWSVLYVLDGAFLDETSPVGLSADPLEVPPHSGPPRPAGADIDWSTIPTLGQRAGDLLPNAGGERFGKLLELVRQERGESGVAVALAAATNLRHLPAWKAAWRALTPTSRDAFHQRVRELLEDDSAGELINALNNVPELRPPDYAEVLVRLGRAALEARTNHGEGASGQHQWLDALVELGDPRAGPLGCELLEGVVSSQLLSGDQYESWEYALATYEGALVAIARHKTPCPWVVLALEQVPCMTSYRCTPSGLVQTSRAAQEEYENAVQDALDRGVPEPPADPQLPLCTATQTQRFVAAWIPPWKFPEESDEEQAEAEVEAESPRMDEMLLDSRGALLLAAAYAQGPLPPDVVLKNKRRLYRRVKAGGNVSSDEEVDASDCFPFALNPAPEEVACTVPAKLTRLRPGACRLEIDDAKQRVTFTAPRPSLDGAEGPTREDARHRD